MKIEYKYLVAIVAVFGLFMDLLDGTIVNVAAPTLAHDFGASTTTIEWVITGYLLSLAVFIPVSGWAGDRFGTKRTFIFALTVFTISSFLCATAWNIESLIAFRILQGVGGGMLTPVGTAMVFRAFPPSERAKASGFMVIPTTVAPASGPVLGGFLVQYVSWEWIFLVNVPVGIIGLFVAWKCLKEDKQHAPGGFDLRGFLLAAAGMASVQYALAEAGSRGFEDARVIGFLVAGAALLAGFVAAELRTKEPMIDVRLFTNRLFRQCASTQFIAMIGFSGALFLLPFLLQRERGLSPFESGLTTFPMAIGVTMMAQPVSRIYRFIGPRRLIATGLLLATISTLMLSALSLETNLWYIRGIMLIRGWGFGMMLVPMQAATFSSVAQADAGRASSIFSVSRMTGQSLGVAISATVLSNRITHHGGVPGAHLRNLPHAVQDHTLLAYHDAFLVAAALTVLGIVMALIIKDSDAAASMRPRVQGATTVESDEVAVAVH
jgi:EmrB/QacA subfamily drug resistance transporter